MAHLQCFGICLNQKPKKGGQITDSFTSLQNKCNLWNSGFGLTGSRIRDFPRKRSKLPSNTLWLMLTSYNCPTVPCDWCWSRQCCRFSKVSSSARGCLRSQKSCILSLSGDLWNKYHIYLTNFQFGWIWGQKGSFVRLTL